MLAPRDIREQAHGKKNKVRHAGEQRTRGLERVHDGLNKVVKPSAFRMQVHPRLQIGITHRCTRRDGEQPCRPQHTQGAKQANVVASVLNARLCEYKCDPKRYHRQGVGARPAMAEVGKVAASDAPGDVDAELEREDEYVILPLLLLCVRGRTCHARGRRRRLFEERRGGVCPLPARWGGADEGDTGGGGRGGSHWRRVVPCREREGALDVPLDIPEAVEKGALATELSGGGRSGAKD
jgi:hypothetical protein